MKSTILRKLKLVRKFARKAYTLILKNAKVVIANIKYIIQISFLLVGVLITAYEYKSANYYFSFISLPEQLNKTYTTSTVSNLVSNKIKLIQEFTAPEKNSAAYMALAKNLIQVKPSSVDLDLSIGTVSGTYANFKNFLDRLGSKNTSIQLLLESQPDSLICQIKVGDKRIYKVGVSVSNKEITSAMDTLIHEIALFIVDQLNVFISVRYYIYNDEYDRLFDSEERLERFKTKDPYNYYLYTGYINEVSALYVAAKAYYDSSYTYTPNPEPLLYMGDCFYNQNQLDSSKRYFTLALEQIDPVEERGIYVMLIRRLAQIECDKGNIERGNQLINNLYKNLNKESAYFNDKSTIFWNSPYRDSLYVYCQKASAYETFIENGYHYKTISEDIRLGRLSLANFKLNDFPILDSSNADVNYLKFHYFYKTKQYAKSLYHLHKAGNSINNFTAGISFSRGYYESFVDQLIISNHLADKKQYMDLPPVQFNSYMLYSIINEIVYIKNMSEKIELSTSALISCAYPQNTDYLYADVSALCYQNKPEIAIKLVDSIHRIHTKKEFVFYEKMTELKAISYYCLKHLLLNPYNDDVTDEINQLKTQIKQNETLLNSTKNLLVAKFIYYCIIGDPIAAKDSLDELIYKSTYDEEVEVFSALWAHLFIGEQSAASAIANNIDFANSVPLYSKSTVLTRINKFNYLKKKSPASIAKSTSAIFTNQLTLDEALKLNTQSSSISYITHYNDRLYSCIEGRGKANRMLFLVSIDSLEIINTFLSNCWSINSATLYNEDNTLLLFTKDVECKDAFSVVYKSNFSGGIDANSNTGYFVEKATSIGDNTLVVYYQGNIEDSQLVVKLDALSSERIEIYYSLGYYISDIVYHSNLYYLIFNKNNKSISHQVIVWNPSYHLLESEIISGLSSGHSLKTLLHGTVWVALLNK